MENVTIYICQNVDLDCEPIIVSSFLLSDFSIQISRPRKQIETITRESGSEREQTFI